MNGRDDDERERLRLEIERLRLENQRLHDELEDARDTGLALGWRARELWRAAWHRYYVARWHLRHRRDARKRLPAAASADPYVVRVPEPAKGERPRVVHFIGNFHTGGSARLVVDLIEQLGDRYDQQIVVRSLPPTPAYTGIELIHRPHLRRARQVGSLLRRLRPDLVHVHLLGHRYDDYGRADLAWYRRIFQAVEAYGCAAIENLNIPVEPYISPAVRCYVHVSDYVRREFGPVGAWNVTIHPGSDFDMFRRTPEQPVADDTIGMVYRLQPDKLDEHSIEPFIEVVRRRPGTRAIIVGGGQLLETCRRRAAQAGVLDAFTFTGYVPYDELAGWLAQMSVFVAPVHTESFGQVSPFAMGMELPVAGYDVGALEEILGSAELLAPPGDANGLADIITGLLDDRALRTRIGRENRERAERLFSVQAMVRSYDELYREVLRAPRRIVSGAPRAPATTRGTPPVTVLMAVHNGARFLREAIESTLGQSFGAFEFLIVDDGSTDATRAIIDSYGDPRIRVVANDRNLGLSASLNRGIRLARGRYIARIDADDVSEPDRLEQQFAFMERHPEIALLGSWYTIIDEHGATVGRRWVPCDQHEIRWMLRFCSAFAHSAVMIRRSVLDDVGLYDESLTYALDWDLWVRIAARARVHNLDRFLVRWRTSPGSMTGRLGDRTERFDRVVAALAQRPDWADLDRETLERRADLLCGIVAGSPPDASPEEAEQAAENLLALHDEYCRDVPAEVVPILRAGVRRDLARALLWIGHRYADRIGRADARRLLRLAARIDPRSVARREGATLLAKLAGGRPVVAAIRQITRAQP